MTRCLRATKTKYSSIAQLAEHSTVNRRVTGSSPVGGAATPVPARTGVFSWCPQEALEAGENSGIYGEKAALLFGRSVAI